ncbi:hypothetical protein Pcinc_029806 [Petrolisthes cinctipes]|uniref:Uncharacterized protein n=1 Tax=Petrolisthes cinctipes TaxID=88211 RepID=A0AAE1EZE3_PETCI|nr:hypothetical protein Pcinc_029806 [Petrolisthes cinctipes]
MASCLPLPFPDHCSPPDPHLKDGNVWSQVGLHIISTTRVMDTMIQASHNYVRHSHLLATLLLFTFMWATPALPFTRSLKLNGRQPRWLEGVLAPVRESGLARINGAPPSWNPTPLRERLSTQQSQPNSSDIAT